MPSLLGLRSGFTDGGDRVVSFLERGGGAISLVGVCFTFFSSFGDSAVLSSGECVLL